MANNEGQKEMAKLALVTGVSYTGQQMELELRQMEGGK